VAVAAERLAEQRVEALRRGGLRLLLGCGRRVAVGVAAVSTFAPFSPGRRRPPVSCFRTTGWPRDARAAK
jgi:hypothetical protein